MIELTFSIDILEQRYSKTQGYIAIDVRLEYTTYGASVSYVKNKEAATLFVLPAKSVVVETSTDMSLSSFAPFDVNVAE